MEGLKQEREKGGRFEAGKREIYNYKTEERVRRRGGRLGLGKREI